jgi:hypothetical protein
VLHHESGGARDTAAEEVMRKTAFIVGVGAALLWAQSNRDAYRDAYKAWRQADPNLEREAASGGAAIGARAEQAASLAARFTAERGGFLAQSARAVEQKAASLSAPNADPAAAAPNRGVSEVVAAESAAVKRNIDTFANDPDPGIRQLRTSLERENLAMVALNNAMAERQKASDALSAATAAAEVARKRTLDDSNDLAGSLRLSADEVAKETAVWSEYYRKLGEGARGAASQVTVTQSAPVRQPSIPAAPVAPVGGADAGSASPAPRTTVAGLPLVRYTGAWVFPGSNGLYHGAQPEFIDLVVHEENGSVTGTLFARFKVASGDPVLRFDFSGQLKNSRVQSFNLETSDGARGTIELIPGPAFNLLEVNFRTDAKPGKVQQGNVVLVKK